MGKRRVEKERMQREGEDETIKEKKNTKGRKERQEKKQ